ncbi:acyltransferase [Novosphingobium sp. 1949]|uniref:Acyltransferase n=1 Tax=Novosphingobium organovorum TaxID=2930092 RepID=A0ABT0BF10_9SPHN|nr:acyltransferase [Novosphingobium organovorum]MCJ2183643.1 acyltransferase [Novosphingobium organovorum]
MFKAVSDEDNRTIYKLFDTLRYPLIVLVVYIHNAGSQVRYADGSSSAGGDFAFNSFLQAFLSEGIARIAVPLFFFMSGYLLFFNTAWNVGAYRDKLANRFRTLLVPFLFWNLFWLAFKIALQLLPQTAAYFSNLTKPFAQYSAFDYANDIFGLTQSPAAYQFWFIRDLMVLVLLSPVIHWLMKRAAVPCLAVLAACWFAGFWPIYVPGLDGLLFFSIGCAMSQRRLDPSLRCDRGFLLTVGAIACLCFAISSTGSSPTDLLWVKRIGVSFGLVWTLSCARAQLDNARWVKLSMALAPAAFFVFAAHEPTLRILRKLVFRIVPLNEFSSVALYITLPVITISIVTAGYFLLLRIAPGFTQVITGGRAAAPASRLHQAAETMTASET